MKCYLRIEKPPQTKPPKFQLVTHDRIFAVQVDDEENEVEVEISHVVTEWHEHNVVGEIRKVEITLLGYLVEQPDGSKKVEVPEEK